MERQVIYTRVSGKKGSKQDENFSRRIQIETCERYGELQGWETYAQFHDTHTGSDYRERPAVQKVLDLIQTGLVQHVTFPVIDRIGRDMHVIETFIKDIYRLGGRVSVANSGATYDSADECITDNFFEISVADYEKRKIKKRTSDGRVRSFLLGSYAKRPPFGYEIHTVTRDFQGRQERFKELRISESNAESIRVILSKYVETRSKAATLRYVNQQALKHNGQPKDHWHYSTIVKVIADSDLYAGIPQTETLYDTDNLEPGAKNPEREFAYPAIINRELAAEVTIANRLNDNPERNLTSPRPFNKLVFCICGRKANYFNHSTLALSKFMCPTGAQVKQAKNVRARQYHENPCKHGISPLIFVRALKQFLVSLDSDDFVNLVTLRYKELHNDLQELQGEQNGIGDMRESLINRRKALTDKLLIIENNPAIVQAIGNEFSEIQAQLDELAARETQLEKEINDIERIFAGTGLKEITYRSVITNAEKTIIDTDSLVQPIRELRAYLDTENWERVGYLMAYLGLRMVADFAEPNLTARRASVRVEFGFDDWELEGRTNTQIGSTATPSHGPSRPGRSSR